MSLHIDFDGLWDVQMKARLDSTLRACIGDPPGGQDWNVFVTSFGGFCTVLVKASQQTRRKVFLLHASELAEAIPDWLKQYPLR